MGICFAILAGLFMPLTNLTVKKSFDVGGKGYFVFQMLFSFIFAVILGPVLKGDFSISLPAAVLGMIAGLILSLMLFTLGKAVERGPSGFTFAILNSATVMPGLLMALVFGEELGYAYHFWHAAGSVLVLLGLFWGAKGLGAMIEKGQWLFFSSSMFFFHILLLVLYQWRAFLLSSLRPLELFSFFSVQSMKSECFAPAMFLSSALLQIAIYLRSEKKMPKAIEIFYGASGGLFNLLCTFFLLQAVRYANPLENAVVFPIFSVVGIILTNVWSQKLYQEKINWRACQLCAFGLMIGSVDWKGIAAAIGF